MRSEQEIERLLEDWLADEAQPMPREVLEGSLESVARTPQTRARGLDWGWLRAPVGGLAAAAVLALVIVAGGLTFDRIGSWFPSGSASPGPTQVWDPVVDFAASAGRNPGPDQFGNPAVWTYLRTPGAEHDPASYVLLPDFADPLTTFGGAAWYDADYLNLLVGKRAAADGIYLHPWSGGSSKRNAVLAWTSPVSGQVTVEGTVARAQHSCPAVAGDIIFSVDRSDISLEQITVGFAQNAEFRVTTSMVVGESLYFIVDADADANCDGTELHLTISDG